MTAGTDALTDVELVRRIAKGEKTAMKQLFDRYEAPLFGYLKSRGADAAAADDAIQDAMLDVWRKASGFRQQASVKTWLFTIARNKLIDAGRKAARIDTFAETPDMPDLSLSAQAVMEAASEAAQVQDCLGRLAPHHLACIRLAFYEDLSYAEISEIERVSTGTIKSRIFHAKRLLMACLERAGR